MSTIKLRTGTTSQWTSANPVLALGEPGYDSDTHVLKVGDGVTRWASLKGYLNEAALAATYVAASTDRPRIQVRPVGGDDTAGVQAFLDDVRAGIREGYLRDNTYRVSNISIDYSAETDVDLGFKAPRIGGGTKRGVVLMQIPGSTGPVLDIVGKAGTPSHAGKVTGLVIENLSIVGTSTGGDGIRFRSVTDVVLRDFWIQKCGRHGIAFDRQSFELGVSDEYAYGIEVTNGKTLLNGGFGLACVGSKPIGPLLVSSVQAEHNASGGMYLNPCSITLTECYIGCNGGPGIVAELASASPNSWGLSMIGGRLEANSAYEADIRSGDGAMFVNVVVLATNGAHGYRFGDGGAGHANGSQVIGGFISGDRSPGQRAVIVGSNARGTQLLSPEIEVAQFKGDYVDSITDIITNSGPETLIRHRGYWRLSSAVKVDTPNASLAFEAWGKNDTQRRFGVRGDGLMTWGTGAAAADTQLFRDSNDRLTMAPGDSFRVDGTWNGGTLVLGPYRLWVDAAGKLRMKNGTPTSDVDGTTIGSQTD